MCVVNRKLVLVINMSDENYVPRRIIVMGGSPGNLRKLNDVNVDQWVQRLSLYIEAVNNMWGQDS